MLWDRTQPPRCGLLRRQSQQRWVISYDNRHFLDLLDRCPAFVKALVALRNPLCWGYFVHFQIALY